MDMIPAQVAVEGCCHGELDAIYSTLQALAEQDGRPIDLLICCGDFQAVRNLDDLECMACPPKYRSIQSFYRYYSGEARAPIPTLFIGGNHEAANHLWELHYGGWAAPNILYLGAAGVVGFGGLRIAGLSGTYAAHHYPLGHFERPPYNNSSMRSAYHVRSLEVHRLARLATAPDIMLSHDWPQGIARHGDLDALLRRKSFLRSEITDNSLGSPPAAELLHHLRPAYWFSAHLHTKFAALVRHAAEPEQEVPQKHPPKGSSPGTLKPRSSNAAPRVRGRHPATRFLSLDKCLPRRQFLQVLDFPEASGAHEFTYDAEWAAVLRATHELQNLAPAPTALPRGPPAPVTPAEVASAEAALRAASPTGDLAVPTNFVATAPAHDPGRPGQRGRMPRAAPRNPQTLEYLRRLGLPYDLDLDAVPGPPHGGWAAGGPTPPQATRASEPNPEEIDLDLESEEEDKDSAEAEHNSNLCGSDGRPPLLASLAAVLGPQNPEEVQLDSETEES
ncbi:hypothetical protein APUTEX25_001731 [Auxenochlorella protothecoides]|uniref:Lariat debranching enzyme C-terminal domain-containing protein n=1 Tax=Auxenochlorella protothecoides TaxID=3075 RepID=A0A3M7L470_AUXPR|nr:hypothetical protein APUTEX25_001731 [Auxenochlorella protothecoides]|eukprot:RMZ57531.1 hypothetical protein APUTEX25_001731 [Auxenochlorella protothecoides]